MDFILKWFHIFVKGWTFFKENNLQFFFFKKSCDSESVKEPALDRKCATLRKDIFLACLPSETYDFES